VTRRVLSKTHRRRRMGRLGLVVLALIVIVAPVMDRAAEAATSADGPMALGFDLCTVAGAILADLVSLPMGESSPLVVPLTLRVPPSTPRVTDHPPRSL
jgi:hypothetical protein